MINFMYAINIFYIKFNTAIISLILGVYVTRSFLYNLLKTTLYLLT